jgi:hypothetical protein
MVVILFLFTGPTQPDMGDDDAVVPSALIIVNVPQKAKDVLVEPVLLLIDKNNVLVIDEPGVQELHKSLPGSDAPTNNKSFDVHELGAGKVCATAVEKNKMAGKKSSSQFLKAGQNQVLPFGLPVGGEL